MTPVANRTFLYRIAKKAFSTLGCKDSEFFEGMGEYFVELATSIGYGDVLAVLGRQFKVYRI